MTIIVTDSAGTTARLRTVVKGRALRRVVETLRGRFAEVRVEKKGR